MALLESQIYFATPVKGDKCYFLELPPELRIQVYEYYFWDTMFDCRVKADGLAYRLNIDLSKWQVFQGHGAAILRCCRKVYNEAYDILRKEAALWIDVSSYRCRPHETRFLGDFEYYTEIKDVANIHLSIDLVGSNNQDFRAMMRIFRALDRCKYSKRLDLYTNMSEIDPPSRGKMEALISLYETIECTGSIHLLWRGKQIILNVENLHGVDGLRAGLGELCGLIRVGSAD